MVHVYICTWKEAKTHLCTYIHMYFGGRNIIFILKVLWLMILLAASHIPCSNKID